MQWVEDAGVALHLGNYGASSSTSHRSTLLGAESLHLKFISFCSESSIHLGKFIEREGGRVERETDRVCMRACVRV